jgi:hypothetical protein
MRLLSAAKFAQLLRWIIADEGHKSRPRTFDRYTISTTFQNSNRMFKQMFRFWIRFCGIVTFVFSLRARCLGGENLLSFYSE